MLFAGDVGSSNLTPAAHPPEPADFPRLLWSSVRYPVRGLFRKLVNSHLQHARFHLPDNILRTRRVHARCAR